jgi:hypothetical protein
MKAFIVDRYGSADRVRASEVPDPEMREDGYDNEYGEYRLG